MSSDVRCMCAYALRAWSWALLLRRAAASRAMLLRSGLGFGCCVAAAAASSRLGLLDDAACCLVSAGLFAMGQIGIQAPPGPWFERCTQEPNFTNSDEKDNIRM